MTGAAIRVNYVFRIYTSWQAYFWVMSEEPPHDVGGTPQMMSEEPPLETPLAIVLFVFPGALVQY